VILPDVNVLLYAFRSDSENHQRYREWLRSIVAGEHPYAISMQVLSSVVRIATHPRIFVKPSRLEEAIAFANALIDQAHCQIVEPGPLHWGIFCDYCRSAQASGNLVQDAWLAALATEAGCEWITTDRDYARFRGLRWRAPF
jgi:toxin-antitoxin system PIN domain toxin